MLAHHPERVFRYSNYLRLVWLLRIGGVGAALLLLHLARVF
jgi:hypothetical protein